MLNEFFVEALWDEDAQVYFSKSDIPGLNIEAQSLGEFEEYLQDLAPVLLIENVLKPALEAAVLETMKPTQHIPFPKQFDLNSLPPVNFRVPERPVKFAHVQRIVMGKGFYPDIVKVLKSNKCVMIRQGKGSHQFWRAVDGKTTTVPNPCKTRHTANKIMKDLGIKHKF